MTRGAFADDLDVMFSDFGESVEVDGEVVCKGHFSNDTEVLPTGGGNSIPSTVVTLRVRAGLLPEKVRRGNCTVILIGHDAVRREYQVESCFKIGDGAMELLSLTGGRRCA